MREILKKISSVCKLIFGYGIMIVLFAGGLTFFGYVAALIIGGDKATAICTWIYKSFTPIMVYVTTVLILFGLLAMYIGGEKALTPGRRTIKKEKKEDKKEEGKEEEKETTETETDPGNWAGAADN